MSPGTAREPARTVALPIALVGLTLLGLIAPTLRGYLWASHESTPLVLRVTQILEVWRAGGDWQAGWLPDVAFGHGLPFFVFYAPLGYYVAALTSLATGCSAGAAVKFSLYLTLLIGAVGTYGAVLALLRNIGAERAAESSTTVHEPITHARRHAWAAAGAIVFSTAPYHYTDIFVRSSLAESWAFALLPGLVWAVEVLRGPALRGPALEADASLPAHDRRLGLALFPLLVALLMISHNITALYGVLFIAVYALATTRWTTAGLRGLLAVAGASALGMALSAWFWWPALELKPLVRAGDVDLMWGSPGHLRGHALFLQQFFMEQWGAGSSRSGPRDPIALNPGLAIMAGLALALAAAWRAGRGMVRRRLLALVALAGVFLFAASVSMPWAQMPALLRYVQFPWRLVAFVVTLGSLALAVGGALTVRRIPPCLLVAPFALAALVLGPLRALSPPAFADDAAELAHYWRSFEREHAEGFYAGGAVLEYVTLATPIRTIQPAHQNQHPIAAHRLLQADAVELLAFTKTGARYDYHYRTDAATTLTAALMYFPGWQATLDGAPAQQAITPGPEGRLQLKLPAGEHRLTLEYTAPPIAEQARRVSGLAMVAWLAALALAAAFGRRKLL